MVREGWQYLNPKIKVYTQNKALGAVAGTSYSNGRLGCRFHLIGQYKSGCGPD